MSQNNNFIIVFGGIIAYILLILYASLVVYMIWEDGTFKAEDEKGITFIVTTIGGLVSALVISQLALAKPGEALGANHLINLYEGKQKKTIEALAKAYLVVWMAIGLAALYWGSIKPSDNLILSGIGTAWIGLADSSAFAYLGVDPTGSARKISELEAEVENYRRIMKEKGITT